MNSFGRFLLLLRGLFRLPQPVTSRAAAARQRLARAIDGGVRMAVRRWRTPAGSIGLGTGDGAAAFENQDVAPSAMVLADAFAQADDAEAAAQVQFQAGFVLGKDAALERPDAGRFGGGDDAFPSAVGRCRGRDASGAM